MSTVVTPRRWTVQSIGNSFVFKIPSHTLPGVHYLVGYHGPAAANFGIISIRAKNHSFNRTFPICYFSSTVSGTALPFVTLKHTLTAGTASDVIIISLLNSTSEMGILKQDPFTHFPRPSKRHHFPFPETERTVNRIFLLCWMAKHTFQCSSSSGPCIFFRTEKKTTSTISQRC